MQENIRSIMESETVIGIGSNVDRRLPEAFQTAFDQYRQCVARDGSQTRLNVGIALHHAWNSGIVHILHSV